MQIDESENKDAKALWVRRLTRFFKIKLLVCWDIKCTKVGNETK